MEKKPFDTLLWVVSNFLSCLYRILFCKIPTYHQNLWDINIWKLKMHCNAFTNFTWMWTSIISQVQCLSSYKSLHPSIHWSTDFANSSVEFRSLIASFNFFRNLKCLISCNPGKWKRQCSNLFQLQSLVRQRVKIKEAMNGVITNRIV